MTATKRDILLLLEGTDLPVRQSGMSLVRTDCCICGDEDADPVAVGKNFNREADPGTFLARRCRGCGLVYLDPLPSSEDYREIGRGVRKERDPGTNFRGRRGLRILEINDPEDAHGPPAKYDLILLRHALEQARSPRDLLLHAKLALAPDGRIMLVTPNTGSTEFDLFGGRHWSGYHFPRHRNLFSAASLQALARATGLEVVSLTTARHTAGWVESLRHLGLDLGWPSLVMRLLPGAWPVFAAIEAVARLRGRASLLVAELQHAGSAARVIRP